MTTSPISVEDNGAHPAPPGADDSWQESWALVWHDPVRRAGGLHHIGLQRVRGIADVWSWVALDGAVVGKFQSLELPLPTEDLPDFVLGGLSVSTKDPLRSFAFSAAFGGDARADLAYEAFIEPFAFSLNADGSTIGKDHYESVGRVEGTLAAGDREVGVSAFAWQDHSWGPRRWTDILAHRWIMATFGPDLFFSVMTVVTAAGRFPMGFVYDGGTFHGIASVDVGATVADDGHSPASCDARIWTTSGGGYHLTATVGAASPSSHEGHFWFTDGLAQYECGGRLGAGILEVHELSAPAPWHLPLLGLAAD
jgi:hypothetical protein